MNNYMKLAVILMIMGGLGACQSQPKPNNKTQTIQRNVPTSTTGTTQAQNRQVPVIKSKDGVQDIRWGLTQIRFKKALFFNDMPFITLNSANQRVQAHTGCNPVYGTYQLNVNNKTLKFNVNAGHASCNSALSQEADLMDAFARTEYFQINGKNMQFLDKNRQVLMTAEQR